MRVTGRQLSVKPCKQPTLRFHAWALAVAWGLLLSVSGSVSWGATPRVRQVQAPVCHPCLASRPESVRSLASPYHARQHHTRRDRMSFSVAAANAELTKRTRRLVVGSLDPHCGSIPVVDGYVKTMFRRIMCPPQLRLPPVGECPALSVQNSRPCFIAVIFETASRNCYLPLLV
jgi:hypothetical protein